MATVNAKLQAATVSLRQAIFAITADNSDHYVPSTFHTSAQTHLVLAFGSSLGSEPLEPL